MSKRIQAGWIILILLMTTLALTACVRPYPGSEASAAQPTVFPMVTQPVIVPLEPVSTPDTSQEPSEPSESVDVLEPTPVAVEPTAESASEKTYIVVAGDTLFKIALEHDVTVDEIAAANGIVNVNSLEIGQELTIPAPGSGGAVETGDSEQELIEETETPADTGTETETAPEAAPTAPATTAGAGGVHVVQPGENLFRIGMQYGCSVEQLSRHNGITTPNRISVGMEIQIPDCN